LFNKIEENVSIFSLHCSSENSICTNSSEIIKWVATMRNLERNQAYQIQILEIRIFLLKTRSLPGEFLSKSGDFFKVQEPLGGFYLIRSNFWLV
jgi:hypothetical protein